MTEKRWSEVFDYFFKLKKFIVFSTKNHLFLGKIYSIYKKNI